MTIYCQVPQRKISEDVARWDLVALAQRMCNASRSLCWGPLIAETRIAYPPNVLPLMHAYFRLVGWGNYWGCRACLGSTCSNFAACMTSFRLRTILRNYFCMFKFDLWSAITLTSFPSRCVTSRRAWRRIKPVHCRATVPTSFRIYHHQRIALLKNGTFSGTFPANSRAAHSLTVTPAVENQPRTAHKPR